MAKKEISKKTYRFIAVVSTGIAIALAVAVLVLMKNDTASKSDNPDGTKTINGTITRIVMDCAGEKYLEDGTIKTVPASICDAGGFIVVDGKEIATQSGYVVAEEFFSYDASSFNPGDKVKVIYIEKEGRATMDCAQCRIESD